VTNCVDQFFHCNNTDDPIKDSRNNDFVPTSFSIKEEYLEFFTEKEYALLFNNQMKPFNMVFENHSYLEPIEIGIDNYSVIIIIPFGIETQKQFCYGNLGCAYMCFGTYTSNTEHIENGVLIGFSFAWGVDLAKRGFPVIFVVPSASHYSSTTKVNYESAYKFLTYAIHLVHTCKSIKIFSDMPPEHLICIKKDSLFQPVNEWSTYNYYSKIPTIQNEDVWIECDINEYKLSLPDGIFSSNIVRWRMEPTDFSDWRCIVGYPRSPK
jgi:hypothetical protein